MTNDSVRSPSGSGHSPSGLSQSPLSQAEPSVPNAARERLSPGFAVFNGHVNDADKRARAFMAKRCPVYLARVEAIEREGKGIMHLFSVCGPTWGPKAACRYIELVTAFVNEGTEA